MNSNFLFIKVDQGFPEHPQTVGLSDNAFRAVIELWCYCHRANTDGKVPTAIFNRYSSRTKTALLAHYVEDRGDHYYMHNYADEQQTAEAIEALKEMRRNAGSAGGKARARNLALAKASAEANAKQDASKIQPDLDIDIDIDKESLRKRKNARSIPADFAVTNEMVAWAQTNVPNVDIRWETPKFIDWHTAKGSLMKDWTAAWRTWMKRAAEQRPAAAAGTKANWW